MRRRLPAWNPLPEMITHEGGHDEGHAEGDSHGQDEDAAHDHAGESGHADESHFRIEKPASVDAAWALMDEAAAGARKAIEAKDAKALHETGEKLAAAVQALHDHPQAVMEKDSEKLIMALDQLSKTVDRFHHASEENDIAAAAEALELMDSQKTLVISLYPVKP